MRYLLEDWEVDLCTFWELFKAYGKWVELGMPAICRNVVEWKVVLLWLSKFV